MERARRALYRSDLRKEHKRRVGYTFRRRDRRGAGGGTAPRGGIRPAKEDQEKARRDRNA